ncbi:MAG: PqqD family protein [Bacteroidia bacterium]
MKVKRNIAISETGFVFDPSTGDSFSVNPIGLDIIQLLKQGKSQEDIEKDIIGKYDVDHATFEKDFSDFVNMLAKLKLSEVK